MDIRNLKRSYGEVNDPVSYFQENVKNIVGIILISQVAAIPQHSTFPMLVYDWFNPARTLPRPQVRWTLPSLQMTMSTTPTQPDHPPLDTKEKGANDKGVAPAASRQRESDAARTLQRTYRGHRARRQLQGLSLDPSTRWFEVCKSFLFLPNRFDSI